MKAERALHSCVQSQMSQGICHALSGLPFHLFQIRVHPVHPWFFPALLGPA
jgi:hypothetical protein